MIGGNDVEIPLEESLHFRRGHFLLCLALFEGNVSITSLILLKGI